MRTIKSYQEQVQDIIENAIYAVKSKHDDLANFAYDQANKLNQLAGKNAGKLILKFEKPETKSDKAKAVAKKAATVAKKKATAAKTATEKATKAAVKKFEKATV